MQQSFQTTLQRAGSRVYIAIPFDPNAVWGNKARHDVTGTINGLQVRGPLVATDNSYVLSGRGPVSRDFFNGLATFYRKNFIRWIESAKRPETRTAHIAEMIELLNAGKREK